MNKVAFLRVVLISSLIVFTSWLITEGSLLVDAMVTLVSERLSWLVVFQGVYSANTKSDNSEPNKSVIIATFSNLIVIYLREKKIRFQPSWVSIDTALFMEITNS